MSSLSALAGLTAADPISAVSGLGPAVQEGGGGGSPTELTMTAAIVVSSARGWSFGNASYSDVGTIDDTDVDGNTLVSVFTFGGALYVFFDGQAYTETDIFNNVVVSGTFAGGPNEYTIDLDDPSFTFDNSSYPGATLWLWTIADNMVATNVYTVTFNPTP